MISNGAYSALKGYDLRTPYNVPMGEVRSMRFVPPFSASALQRDTISYKLIADPCKPTTKYDPPPTIPRLTTSLCSYQATCDSCTTGQFSLRTASGSVASPGKTSILRLVYKNSMIK